MKNLIFVVFTFMAAIVEAMNAFEYYVTLYQRNFSTGVIFEHEKCPASGAQFGGNIGYDDLYGCPVFTKPEEGCSKIVPPPIFNISQFFTCLQYIAVIRRGNCTYAEKAYLAQEANFQAVIIYDNVYNTDVFALPDDGVFGSKIQIPAFFVSKRCGVYMQKFPFESGNMLKIHFFELDFFQYLVPFIVVVSICFLIALIALVARYIKDKRHELRRRLSRRKLKRIPTKKYKKNEIPETCPICLDDFDEGEKLRILPCSHWYHVKCIDPWLTKNRKVCPVCKRKVLPDESDSSDSENERAPLIAPEPPPSRYGSVLSSYNDEEDYQTLSLHNSPSMAASPGSDFDQSKSETRDPVLGGDDVIEAPSTSSGSGVAAIHSAYVNPVFAEKMTPTAIAVNDESSSRDQNSSNSNHNRLINFDQQPLLSPVAMASIAVNEDQSTNDATRERNEPQQISSASANKDQNIV